MEDIKLKPCPFCGCKDVYVHGNTLGDSYVRCPKCSTTGPSSSSEEDAIKWWNMWKPFMSRVDENADLIENIIKLSENQQRGSCEQVVAWNVSNIAAFLLDISKSLAVIADHYTKED